MGAVKVSVTFEWTEPHSCGGRYAVYLDDEIKMTILDMSWQRVLASNLAMAALLGAAANHAYWKGVMDQEALTKGYIDKLQEHPHPGLLVSGVP